VATYGVTPGDVAARLPGLFPQGFSVATVPTIAQVQTFIDTADVRVTMAVQDVTGVAPQLADQATLLAKEFIIARAVANVLAVLYVGSETTGVNPAVGYFAAATELLKALTELGAQAVGLGTTAPNIGVNMPVDRELLICDAELDGSRNRLRRY
jgi:hypothetical protein